MDSTISRSHITDVEVEHAAEHGGHIPLTPEEITADLISKTSAQTDRFKYFVYGLAALTVIGFIAMIVKIVIHGDEQAEWGYVAAMTAFLLTAAGGAPLVAVGPVVAKANWVRPLTRISAAFSLVSVVTILMLIPLLFVLPPLVTEGARRRSIWFNSPDYSPHFWAVVALLILLTAGVGLFYSSALPDFAAMRDHSTGWRQRLGAKLARGWLGTDVQWRTLRMRIGMFGTLYFLVLIFVHFLISTDFGMGLVPGWRDAIFPMYHSLTSIQAGVAAVILAAWAGRRYMGLENYFILDQFWALGRLLFASSLLWFYFFFSAFIVFWYGRAAPDVAIIDLLIKGPMQWAFVAGILMSFVVPWWWLIWNRVRTSVNGPAIGATIVLFGILLDRVRLYVTAWSIPPEDIHDAFVTEIPGTVWPEIWDLLVMLGALAFAVLIVALVTRIVPPVSIWEAKHSRMLTRPIKYVRGRAVLLGKPD